MSALGAGLSLAACAPKPTPAPPPKAAEPMATNPPPAPADKKVDVRYASWWGTFNTGPYPEVVKDFQDEFPNVNILLEEVPYAEAETKYSTTLAAGNAADILYHMNFMSKYYDEGVILDQTSLFEAAGLDYWNDFWQGLAINDWAGKIYGFPHMLHTCFFLYNKTLIEEYWGQDLWEAFPDGMWDITDMVEVAKACTQDTTGDGMIDKWGLYMYHRSWYYGYETLGWTKGDSVFDVQNVKFNFSSEVMDQVSHTLFDWVRKDKFLISQEDYAEVNKAAGVGAPFYAGITALRHRLSGDVNRAISTVGDAFEWDLMYLPNDGDNLAVSEALGHGHNIAKSSKVANEAFEFVKFCGTTPGLQYLAKSKDSVPVYKKDPSLREMLETGGPEHTNVIIGTLEDRGGYGDHMRFHNEGECLSIFQNELDLLYNEPYEEAKPKLSQAMKDLEEQLNSIVDYGDTLPWPDMEFPFRS